MSESRIHPGGPVHLPGTDLAAIRRRAEALSHRADFLQLSGDTQSRTDSTFMSQARRDIDDLLAEVEWLTAVSMMENPDA